MIIFLLSDVILCLWKYAYYLYFVFYLFMIPSPIPPFLFVSPLYDWKSMEKDGFSWWVKRIKRALNLYDEFRIDHFRGFAGFWAIPAG